MSLSKVKKYRKTEEDVDLETRSAPASSGQWNGVVRGVLAGLSQDGTAMVDFAGNPERNPVSAISTVMVGGCDRGREAVLMFEDGDVRRPILLGLVQPTASATPSHPPVELSLDGERLALNAEKEIVLRCGDASITLTRAGKIIIRGAYLLSRSSGVNRIKGGSIQLN